MQRKELACKAIKKYNISSRRAGNIFNISRKRTGAIRTSSLTKSEENIKKLALKYPDYGYRMITSKLRLEGVIYNHKKVYRIYKKLGLNLKYNKKSKKIPARKKILELADNLNQIWSLDFMSGSVKNKKFRAINIIDEFNREALDIRIDYSLSANKVINILEEIINHQKRKPIAFRIDNGTEFTSNQFTKWANDNNIILFYIQPGKPYQNCYIERFNGTYRREVLNKYIFESLDEVQNITDDWLYEYNHHRPHSSLGGLPPRVFVEKL